MVTKSKGRKRQIRILEQGIALVKFLSSNNENERNKALKKTKRVLEYRSQVKDCDFSANEARILWKGLFYCLWMADKPLYQEQVAESISQLVHCFTSLRDALTFVEAFFATMSHEWLGIDQFRMDKCLMLVRRMVRQSMHYVRRQDNWSPTAVNCLANCYANILRKSQKGLIMQLAELYLTELAKVSEGKLDSEQVFQIVRPFADYFITLNDGLLISQVIVPIFFRLIEQTDIGIEHQLKWEAWRDRGFPGGSIDVMEKVDGEEGEEEKEDDEGMNDNVDDISSDDDDDDDKPLDPRAGRVDVELPTLNIDPRMFVKLFSELKERKELSQLSRKQLTVLIKKYATLAEGKFPLGMQRVELPPKTNWKNVTMTAAKQLAVDLMDDELTKLESLNRELGAGCQIQETVVGRWQVDPANSPAVKQRKKNMRREAAKRVVGLKWITTPTKAADSEDDDKVDSHREDDDKVDPHRDGDANVDPHRTKVTDDGKVSPHRKKAQDDDKVDSQRKPAEDDKVDPQRKMVLTLKNEKKKRKLEENGVQSVKVKKKKKQSNGIANNKELRINGGEAVDEWSKPLEEGETEIFIPNKKYVQKRKELGLSTPQAEFVQSCSSNNTTPSQRRSLSGKEKKVLFVLTRNKSQDEKEYLKTLRTKPEIPYNSEKQPEHPIYKDTGVKSPINPFYKNLGYTKMKNL